MPRGRLTGTFLLLLGACQGGGSGPATAARVQLSGGANPGAYEVRSETPACARDLVGPGSWGVQLTDWTGPKAGLRSLQLVVPVRTTSDQFYLGMVFGDFFTGIVHEIETRPDAPRRKGQGSVTVQERGDGATISVTGLTQDSVSITATIACALPPAEQRGSE